MDTDLDHDRVAKDGGSHNNLRLAVEDGLSNEVGEDDRDAKDLVEDHGARDHPEEEDRGAKDRVEDRDAQDHQEEEDRDDGGDIPHQVEAAGVDEVHGHGNIPHFAYGIRGDDNRVIEVAVEADNNHNKNRHKDRSNNDRNTRFLGA